MDLTLLTVNPGTAVARSYYFDQYNTGSLVKVIRAAVNDLYPATVRARSRITVTIVPDRHSWTATTERDDVWPNPPDIVVILDQTGPPTP